MEKLVNNIYLIFWGVLIVIFDLRGLGVPFDIINDLVGSIMIFTGLYKISKIEFKDTSFKSKMNFCLIASAIQILYYIPDFFLYPIPDSLSTLTNIIDLVIAWGIVSFAAAMIRLSKENCLDKSLKKWIKTKKFLLYIYFLPYAALTLIAEVMSFHKEYKNNWLTVFGLDGNIGGILMIAIFVVPIIYWLSTMHFMEYEIMQKYKNNTLT